MPTISADNSAVDQDQVMKFRTWCERCGFSPETGRRLIRDGKGPTVTQLSARRIGIREKHYREWLDSRAETRSEPATA